MTNFHNYLIQWDNEQRYYRVGSNPNTEVPYDAVGGLVENCPNSITFPRSYNDGQHGNHPVAEIGRFAFRRCGLNGNTTSVMVTKEIRVIRFQGLSLMDNVNSFSIEAESRLEVIETGGIADFGRNCGGSMSLILPASLHIIHVNGIHQCDLFECIVFCGRASLVNESDLVQSHKPLPKIYVAPWYNGDSFLGNAMTVDVDEILSRCAHSWICSCDFNDKNLRNILVCMVLLESKFI